MNEKHFTRDFLLEIVETNLSKALNPPDMIQAPMSFLQYNEKKEKFVEELQEAIENIKNAFMDAGLEREYRRILKNFPDMFFYLTKEESTFSQGQYHDINYENLLKHLSDLKFAFITAIKSKIPVDEKYDTQLMEKFINGYLSGFIYDQNYMDNGMLNDAAMQRIEAIYKFYGIELSEESKGNITRLQIDENNNYLEKKDLRYERERIYHPDILGEYIIKDIQNQLSKPKKEETREQAQPVNTSSQLSTDEKVEAIRKALEEYDRLSAKEQACLEELERIRAEKRKIAESFNGLKQ